MRGDEQAREGHSPMMIEGRVRPGIEIDNALVQRLVDLLPIMFEGCQYRACRNNAYRRSMDAWGSLGAEIADVALSLGAERHGKS